MTVSDSLLQEALVAGSEDRWEAQVHDIRGDQSLALDLTDCAVVLRYWYEDTGASGLVQLDVTPDPDQVTRRGWWYRDLEETDFPRAGWIQCALWVTLGQRTWRSRRQRVRVDDTV